jgi:hypothetical protein
METGPAPIGGRGATADLQCAVSKSTSQVTRRGGCRAQVAAYVNQDMAGAH